MKETGRFFMVTGFEDEYGFAMEEVKDSVKIEADEVLLNNALGNCYFPDAYNLDDVTEISKETYDKLIKLHMHGMENGWDEKEQAEFERITNEINGSEAHV